MLLEVEQGTVRGSARDTFSVFTSIPYAAPPRAAGRFEPPRPPEPWRGVRGCTRRGATAPQPARGHFGSLDVTPYFTPGWVRGDDYLTVNVWAPPISTRLAPVLVFLHGGGFIAGSSHSPLLDGHRFAEDGVVLVTVNYRLGMAGFLDVPPAPPNRGLADVLAALAWVQRNIAAFGGDRSRVTLAGQSAGAMLTAAAIASDEAAGLFHQAIMQSGSGTPAFSREQAAIVCDAAARLLEIPPGIDGFVNLTDEQLVAATPALTGLDLGTNTARDPLQRIAPFSVVLDEQPADVISSGHGHPVDLLVGHNADEGNLYLVPSGVADATTPEDLQSAAAEAFSDPARLIGGYSGLYDGASPGVLRSIILGEAVFGVGSRRMADVNARVRRRTFAYQFTWRSSALDGVLGATHVVEIPFVFDTVQPAVLGNDKLLGVTPPPGDLVNRMHHAWVDFVMSGSPGWPEYDLTKRSTMRIDTIWTLAEDPFKAERAVWT